MELLVATQNPNKVRELRAFLQSFPCKLLDLKDVALGHLDVEETGSSFEENATLKAVTYGKASGKITISDDGGLAIDELNGEPGIYSARYGDVSWSFEEKINDLLKRLREIPEAKRTAKFICVLALYNPVTEECLTLRGVCEGTIAHTPQKGIHGFAYDPIFIPKGYDQSFSQISPEMKNSISHRALAMKGVVTALKKIAKIA